MFSGDTTMMVRTLFAKLFACIFLGLALAIVFSLLNTVVNGLFNHDNVMQIFLSSINTGIIALAVFELAFVINKEYSGDASHGDNVVATLRRTIPGFIGTVCVALSLEGLIMVIKYSQLELAGNLYYPVAIICATAFLLAALALFLHLTRDQADGADIEATGTVYR
ncbi:MAG: hypothetical protein P1U64_07165 [Alcanivoracaceae bacterium]|nr:hypothetical protein [Alcanivoracaceae bacterium]